MLIMGVSTFICSSDANFSSSSTAASAVNFIVFRQFAQLSLDSIFSPSLVRWMDMIYALAFAQNAMTTGLIVYRIWRQDRQSKVLLFSSFRLIVIVRIIVESASIYLLNILILIIFYAFNSNGQNIAEEAIAPVCGECYHVQQLPNIYAVSCMSRYYVHFDHSPSIFAHFNIQPDYPISRYTAKICQHSRYDYR
jgi:hypothetical protein